MKSITSLQNPLIKQLISLKTTSGRHQVGQFLISGFHLLEMALSQQLVKLVLCLEPVANVPIEIEQIMVTPEIIQKLSNQVTPQGVVAVCDYLSDYPIEGNHLAYLDGVSDPGNLGTILRSATAFGIDMVLLSPTCASLYNPKTIAASQGALFTTKTKVIKDTSELALIKERGYSLIGTMLDSKAQHPNTINWTKPCIVAFGNEAHGLSPEVIQLLDTKIMIPINGIESLNVAMAASIIFYVMKCQ